MLRDETKDFPSSLTCPSLVANLSPTPCSSCLGIKHSWRTCKTLWISHTRWKLARGSCFSKKQRICMDLEWKLYHSAKFLPAHWDSPDFFFFFSSSHFNVNVSALKCFRLLSIYFSVLQWAGIKRKQHKQTKTKQIKAAASFPSLTGMLLWMGQSKSPPKASQPALKRQHLTHAGQSPWCWALLCCGSSIHHTACPWAEGRLDQLPCWCRCCGVSYATGNVKVVKPGCTGFTVVYSSQGANLGTPASEHGWQDLCVLLRSPVETCYPGMARVLWLVLGLTKHRCCWQENFFHYGFSWNSAVFQLGGYDLLTTGPHLVFNGLCCSCSNLLHLNPMVWVGRKMFPWILHIKANTSAWNMLARLGVRRKFLFATV